MSFRTGTPYPSMPVLVNVVRCHIPRVTLRFTLGCLTLAVPSGLVFRWFAVWHCCPQGYAALHPGLSRRNEMKTELSDSCRPIRGLSIGKSKFVWTLRLILILRVKQVDSTFCICLLYIFEHNCGTNRRRTSFIALHFLPASRV